MYFFGYSELGGNERVELYDLIADPEELNDLSTAFPSIVANLLEELTAKIETADQPYTT